MAAADEAANGSARRTSSPGDASASDPEVAKQLESLRARVEFADRQVAQAKEAKDKQVGEVQGLKAALASVKDVLERSDRALRDERGIRAALEQEVKSLKSEFAQVRRGRAGGWR